MPSVRSLLLPAVSLWSLLLPAVAATPCYSLRSLLLPAVAAAACGRCCRLRSLCALTIPLIDLSHLSQKVELSSSAVADGSRAAGVWLRDSSLQAGHALKAAARKAAQGSVQAATDGKVMMLDSIHVARAWLVQAVEAIRDAWRELVSSTRRLIAAVRAAAVETFERLRALTIAAIHNLRAAWRAAIDWAHAAWVALDEWLSDWRHPASVSLVLLTFLCARTMWKRHMARLAARICRSSSWPVNKGRAGRKRSADYNHPRPGESDTHRLLDRHLPSEAAGQSQGGASAADATLAAWSIAIEAHRAKPPHHHHHQQQHALPAAGGSQSEDTHRGTHAFIQPTTRLPLRRSRSFAEAGRWSDPRGTERAAADVLHAAQVAADAVFAAESAAAVAAIHAASCAGDTTTANGGTRRAQRAADRAAKAQAKAQAKAEAKAVGKVEGGRADGRHSTRSSQPATRLPSMPPSARPMTLPPSITFHHLPPPSARPMPLPAGRMTDPSPSHSRPTTATPRATPRRSAPRHHATASSAPCGGLITASAEQVPLSSRSMRSTRSVADSAASLPVTIASSDSWKSEELDPILEPIIERWYATQGGGKPG